MRLFSAAQAPLPPDALVLNMRTQPAAEVVTGLLHPETVVVAPETAEPETTP